jgi:hypothetical protein
MTEQDKKLRRAQLQVDIEDAESDLAFLRDEAAETIHRLEQVAETVRRNADLEPSPTDFTAEGDIVNRLTPTQVADFETSQSVSSLIERLKKARQVLFTLRERKRKLVVA